MPLPFVLRQTGLSCPLAYELYGQYFFVYKAVDPIEGFLYGPKCNPYMESYVHAQYGPAIQNAACSSKKTLNMRSGSWLSRTGLETDAHTQDLTSNLN